MAKFNPKQMQYYVTTLQDVLTNTQETADHVSPFFVKLDEAKEAGKVKDMAKAEFGEIKAEFDDAVSAYQANAKTLAAVQVPVRFMGVHKTLAKAYADYAEATKMMADALNEKDQSIDEAAFAQSEKDQETYLTKIQAQVSKIFGA
ncbi:chemotaxis protein [Fructobacillus papyrifericola]|uniref:Chemotaxis protein n=1 Tax=Fructobacillus papyrifericola TaxID=2713172 RepID=A0ABS5QTC2_9LACO|nr:chemotaxis protein [Fructobacillus papyrifericola]MBS9336371.1 chemotaxis protein [Fructobacillus papyrifericola]